MVGRKLLASGTLLCGAVAGLIGCSFAPTPDQPTTSASNAISAATPSGQVAPSREFEVRFTPCMISDEAIGEALGLEITVSYPSEVGNPGEYLCSYQTAEGTVLEINIFPPVDHRVPGIGVYMENQATRQAPEERPIVIEDATDAHGYLTFPGIDVRFDTNQAFVLLQTSSLSDESGLDGMVEVANLVVEALAILGPT